MDARGLEARMEMIVQEILADETKEMDLSLRLGLDSDKGAVGHVGPIRKTARPTSLWSPYSRGGVPDVNFRHYPHQLNASRSLGPWARILERGPAPTLQQRIGQLSIGGGSDGHPGANPFPRQARLGNFLAPLPPPPPPPLPPAVSNVLGGSPPIFPGYPALPPLVTVNRNSSIPSLDMSPARQYLQEMMANVDASSSHNNANNNNNNNNNNNVNYSEWSGFMMGRGHENNGQGERPVKRCSNSRCNTAETPMWRRGPLGPKSLCNACGIKFRKEEERRQASEEAAAASSSMASQWLPPHFLM